MHVFLESTTVGEKHGPTDFRESHRRAKYRVHRRLSDVNHGIVADGKWSICKNSISSYYYLSFLCELVSYNIKEMIC